MKKKLVSTLLTLAMVLAMLPTAVLAAGTPISIPTELTWGRDYSNDGTDTPIPGSISWKPGGNTQNKYKVEIYNANDTSQHVYTTTWSFGASDNSAYRSVDAFIGEGLPSGTYYFTIQELGDDMRYSNSEIAKSDNWVYQQPNAQLPKLEKGTWAWPEVNWTPLTDKTHVYGYEVEFLFSKTANGVKETIGSTRGYDPEAALDEILDRDVQDNGEGYYFFKVRAISKDITAIQCGPWSDLSEAYNLTATSDATKGELDKISENASESEIKTAVQAIGADDLKSAMLADQGASAGVISKLAALEEKAGGAATVNATNFTGFATDKVSIVGANLNTTTSGAKATLNIGQPTQKDHVIPTLVKNTVAFSMDLGNVTNTTALQVPVQVTLPIPDSINSQFLVILHYHQNGTYEEVKPYVFSKEGQKYASFVLTSFSDFVMAEKVNAVATVGDTDYASLADALEKATSGNTVTLWKNDTLSADATVAAGVTLVISPDVILTVAANKTLTNSGTIANHGTIGGGGTVSGDGKITNYFTVTFTTTPADAAVNVTDANNAVVNPFDRNQYSLQEDASYTYTVSRGGYVTQSAAMTAAKAETIIVTLTAQRGGGGGGGGGSAAVTVPVTGGDQKVTVNATVSGTTANISSVDISKLAVGGGDNGVLSFDLSGLSQKVDGVNLPTKSMSAIVEAKVTGLSLKLNSGSLTFDAQALAAILEQADGTSLSLVLRESAQTALNAQQKTAIAADKSPMLVDVTMTSGGKIISDFQNGSATVEVPYALPAGNSRESVQVNHLATDGTLTKVDATYHESSQTVRFTNSRFSTYVVTSEAAAPISDWDNPFTDVGGGDWFYEAVAAMARKGLMSGTSPTTFTPNGTTTRGMLVTTLHRLEGQPSATAAGFADVAQEQYYAVAVAWAAAQDLVTGYDSSSFGPNDTITREQLAVILYRYARYKGLEAVDLAENLSQFADQEQISSYAVSALNWAVGQGLITGMGDGTLAPQGGATRAQVATIFTRFRENIAK